MFEKRSDRELIIIYVIIALVITFLLGIFHYYTWSGVFGDPVMLIIMGNIEFFVIFYILYLPVRNKRSKK